MSPDLRPETWTSIPKLRDNLNNSSSPDRIVSSVLRALRRICLLLVITTKLKKRVIFRIVDKGGRMARHLAKGLVAFEFVVQHDIRYLFR